MSEVNSQKKNKFNKLHCCVPGCTSDGQKNEDISFHQITNARKKNMAAENKERRRKTLYGEIHHITIRTVFFCNQ